MVLVDFEGTASNSYLEAGTGFASTNGVDDLQDASYDTIPQVKLMKSK